MGCTCAKEPAKGSRRTTRGSRGARGSHSASKKKAGPLPVKKIVSGGIGHAQFIFDNQGRINEFYEIEKEKLGEGSFGSVSKAKNKSTGAIRAVKAVSKAEVKNIETFKQEIAIMKMMDHPNIIKLYETFEDRRRIYLVMELCEGGELFERIIDEGRFTEVQAAILMQQIIRAIYYMHENKVCHRDVKPENFLFLKKKTDLEHNILKVIDFGLSTQFEEGQILTTKAGTPYYVAPQVLSGKYDSLCDMWSCGVIMYIMLCGYPPFFGDSDTAVLNKVRLGAFSMESSDWRSVSEDAKDLIRKLLKVSPAERFTASKAMKHVWITDKAPKATDVCLQTNFVDNLRSFRSQNKLKKAALHIIASNLNEDQIQSLRETFVALDDNGDGLLTSAEMRQGLTKAGLSNIPADLQQILEDVDCDGSGVIDYTEFLAATLDRRQYVREDVCWSAFRIFDRNGDGKISPEEMKLVLERGEINDVVGRGSIQEIMEAVDGNGDGMIDFEEFLAMMRKTDQLGPLDNPPPNNLDDASPRHQSI